MKSENQPFLKIARGGANFCLILSENCPSETLDAQLNGSAMMRERSPSVLKADLALCF